MKTYVCDCCGQRIENPYRARMRQFCVGYETLGLGQIVPCNVKERKRVDLCESCYQQIAELSRRKEAEHE